MNEPIQRPPIACGVVLFALGLIVGGILVEVLSILR